MGLIRTNNEDNFIVNPDLTKQDNWFIPGNTNEEITMGPNGCVLVVADGMGGMNAGEVASELATVGIKEAFAKVSDLSEIIKNNGRIEMFLRKVIADADALIKQRLKEDPSTTGMGTTVVLVWVLGTTAHVVWCGDSRAYLFNPNSGIVRLTKDHSYVQELVDSGKLDAELAFNHPNSNIITRSLGDSPSKVHPDYSRRELQQGDTLLLCSDGLCGLCRDEEICDIMVATEDLGQCKTNLITAALDAGGHDNVTVALMKLVSAGDSKANLNSASTLNDQKRARKRTIMARCVAVAVLLVALFVLLLFTDQIDCQEDIVTGFKDIISTVKDKVEAFIK